MRQLLLSRPILLIVAAAFLGTPTLALGAGPALSVQDTRTLPELGNNFGTYEQTIPIEVPPFHGIQPNLALSYSSSAGNGFVGVGWNLAGLSVIERRQPRMAAPKYDATDVYYLDGMKLVNDTSLGGTWTAWGGSGRRRRRGRARPRIF